VPLLHCGPTRAKAAYAVAGAANPLEIADLRATATVVGELARASGGGVHWLGTAAAPDIPECAFSNLLAAPRGRCVAARGDLRLQQQKPQQIVLRFR